MKAIFDKSGLAISKLVTNTYSTSFSLGIRLLDASMRPAIYAIYGFVRYADEIVDSFHDYDQSALLEEFESEYKKSIERGISLNPILNSFQKVVLQYDMEELVVDFLNSMKMDLYKRNYTTKEEYQKYIFGSADTVGLMCLKVFVDGDEERYRQLKPFAMRLGSAFQKVNFLRDLKSDYHVLGRSYFPDLQLGELDQQTKTAIVEDIKNDFEEAFKGILQLPMGSRLGVYVAYRYYLLLLEKLNRKSVNEILCNRIRIHNMNKILVLLQSYFRFKLNIL